MSSHASCFERHISIESGFLVIQTHDGCEGNLRRPHFTLSWEMQGLSKHGSQEPGKGACSAKASTSPGPSQVWSLPAYHQSLFTSMATSGHRLGTLLLSGQPLPAGLPGTASHGVVPPAGFQQTSYLSAATVYMLISSIRPRVPGGQRWCPNLLPSLRVYTRELLDGSIHDVPERVRGASRAHDWRPPWKWRWL